MKINSFIYKILSLIILGAILQSCLVAKKYESPEMKTESSFRTDLLAKDSSSIATTSWKEFFTDPTLQQLIEEGLNNNLDVRMALQQINIAEAYVRQGKAGYYPTFGMDAQVSYQYNSQNTNMGVIIPSTINFEISGMLTWEADIWGKIRSSKRAADASYLQTIAGHQAIKGRLVASIASAYYQLKSLDKQIEITEETIVTREKSLSTVSALKDAGSLTEAAVKQTEAQLYNAQALLVDLKANAKILENAISILLGSSPRSIQRNELSDNEITIPLEMGVPTTLLRQRPDLRQAEYRLMEAFEGTNIARASLYPALRISAASGGIQSNDINNLFSLNSLFGNIIGGLTAPIFQGRKLRTQYEAAQFSEESTKLSFFNVFINASREVSDALYKFQAADTKINLKENEFSAYQLARDYSQDLMDNGIANYLEVLTAEEAQLRARIDLINTKNQRLQAIVELYRALGGGWE